MAVQFDLTGQRFGNLLVLGKTEPQPDGAARWHCRCDCGNECIVRSASLRRGQRTDCGCKTGLYYDLTGQRFGRLVVLRREQTEKKGNTYWRCKCDCGTECVFTPQSLRNGTRTNCGCEPKQKRNGRLVDMTGQRFGSLLVLGKTEPQPDGVARWHCRCDCGNECIVRGVSLQRGQRTDCGCKTVLYYDLTDQRFGHLLVMERDYTKGRGNSSYWRCQCDCGRECAVKSDSLRAGVRTECGNGCKTRPQYHAIEWDDDDNVREPDNKLVDMTGQRFGRLTVIEKIPPQEDARTRWLCACDCGNTCVVTAQSLRKRGQQSCGCGKIKDLRGQRFGKLTVVARSDHYVTLPIGTKKYMWECRCDCGETVYRLAEKLREEINSSCVKCAQKNAASLMLEHAGFMDGTQLYKITTNKPNINNKSGIRGVFRNSRTQKWRAMLRFKGKNYYLGEYEDIQKAVEARKKAEGICFGEYLESVGLENSGETK